MDLYDMKPEAPVEYRGIWMPIRTNVPGFQISPLFPRQAKCANLFSIVRSLHHDTGDHFTGGHAMLTSRRGRVSGLQGRRRISRASGRSSPSFVARTAPGMPAYVAAPAAHSIGIAPGYHGGNYLGNAYNPFDVGQDPNLPSFHVNNLRCPMA